MSAGLQMGEVLIVGVPVELWARSQELSDDLVRELTLIAIGDRPGEKELPKRFTQVIEELTAQYGHLGAAQERQLREARDAGVDRIDLSYELPPETAGVATQIGELLDEVDEYCRAGNLVLTLAAPPEIRAFRWWFLDEIRRQLEGGEPTRWESSDWYHEVKAAKGS